MSVAIVGGGIMGVSLGYFLTRAGFEVEIFEASSSLGGLAGQVALDDGTNIDRFYHAILSSDVHLRELCAELGIAERLRFTETRTGFYHRGQIYPMNNALDFLRFPPLGWLDRFRLARTVIEAHLVRDWRRLEEVSVEAWLRRLSGSGVFESIWRPLLGAKFDGGFDSIPATYIWARLVRMKSARKGATQKELVGHLVGGHIALVEAMAEGIRGAGGKIHLNAPVQEIMVDGRSARGLSHGKGALASDAVIVTLPLPRIGRLIPGADPALQDSLSKTEYLGIIAALLVLDRPLSGYWTLNLTDDRIPFTGLIETTTYIDPQYVGGHHLVYLPKYVSQDSRWQLMTDADLRDQWLKQLEAMFPTFDRGWIRHFLIHRELYAEPLHPVGGTDQIPSVTMPIDNLYLVNTAQIYPELTHAESLIRHARRATRVILEDQARLRRLTTEPAFPEHVREQAHILYVEFGGDEPTPSAFE